MPTTLTHVAPAQVAVHQPKPVELWLAQNRPYEGRHRGPAEPENGRQDPATPGRRRTYS